MEKTIPTKINKYNVYNDTERLLGMGDEVTLPDFEAMSDTISGAGSLGEIEDPTVGYFGNQEMEIPFRVVDQEAVDMMNMTKAVHLTLRSAQQTTDKDGNIDFRQMRVVVRGRCKKFSPGKVKSGSSMDTKITLTVIYIKIEVDGERLVELDKMSGDFWIRNENITAKIKEMC